MKLINRNNWVLSIGLISGFSGLCLILTRPLILDCLLCLEWNPILLSMWKNVDLETSFYLFNWTNPEEVNNGSVKPKFAEIGPFVFHLKEEKSGLVWNDNGTVTFKQQRFFYFDESQSRCLEQNITNVDMIHLGASYVSRNWNFYVRKGLLVTLYPYFSNIHKTKAAREWLFDGYREPLIKVARPLPFLSHFNIPDYDNFGYTFSRNDSSDYDGVFNMGTGRNTVLGELYKWNYKSATGYFEGDCNKVAGSASQIYPRNLQSGQPIEFFSSDLRRRISLKFEKEVYFEGLLGYTYVAGDYTLDNGTINPKNKCFCPDECTPRGVANLSSTRHGIPLFASLPHFYTADPYYLSLVDGLEPAQEKHESYITIEPITGMVLKVDGKLQVNALMQPVDGTNLFEKVPKVFIPVLWAQLKAESPYAGKIFLKLLLVYFTWSLYLGVVFLLLAACLLLYEGIKSPRRLQCSQKIQVVENQLRRLQRQ